MPTGLTGRATRSGAPVTARPEGHPARPVTGRGRIFIESGGPAIIPRRPARRRAATAWQPDHHFCRSSSDEYRRFSPGDDLHRHRDRTRAKSFYLDVLGLALTQEDAFAAVFDLNGIMLRISTVEDHVASPHTVLGWQVPDIRATVSALRDRGVCFRIYPGFDQDEFGIWTVPGGTGKVAWFADPDGNLLSMAEP